MAMPLRHKLILLNIFVIGTTSILLVGLVYLLVSYQMRQEMWGFLSDEFNEYALHYQEALDDASSLEKEMQEHFTKARMAYPITCRVYDETGRKIVNVDNVREGPLTDSGVIDRALQGEELSYRLPGRNSKGVYWCSIRQLVSPSGKVFAFELGLKIDRINLRIARLLNYLLALIPVILLISAGGGWWITRRSLQPFGDLLNSLQRIRTSSLDSRLPVRKTGDELDKLAIAANEMLTDIQVSYTAVKEFTGDAAHELRTPLARLSMMLESSLSKTLSSDETQDILDEAYEQCMRLRRLIDDLMLLARLDAGEAADNFTSFDLAELFDDLEELWTTACEERHINIEVLTDRPLLITGGAMLLRRLLANLVDNALRYTPQGGLIQVVARKDREDIQIAVKDTGPGIAEKELPKLFNRFYRIDYDRDSDTGGTGLGLSICRKITRLHNGDISIDSSAGKGSTFSVRLPRTNS